MRATTIFPSSRWMPLALAVLLGGASASPAQDTVRAVPDTEQAMPEPEQVVPDAGLGLAQASLPQSHTVVRGETLWSIAQVYFGDALLWPEIYRLNTAVVEDPHWIYPGEVLMLAPYEAQVVAQGPADTAVVIAQGPGAADTVRAQVIGEDTVAVDTMVVDTMPIVVVEEPPPPTTGYQTIFDRAYSRTDEVQQILRRYANQPYRPLRRGEFYQAGFLTENQRLPFGEVLGNTAKPAITRLTPQSSARRYDEIAIKPPGDVSYHVGDSVLIVRLDRSIPNWGEVVVPHGIAEVTAVQDRQILARVLMQWSRIQNGNLVLPLEPFRDPGNVRPTPVQQGLEGQLIAQRELHALVVSHHFLFIDRGRKDGVVPGDMVEVYDPSTEEPGAASERVLVTLLIVHTREQSATGLVIGVNHPALMPGMPVRLVKKMPS